MATRSSCDAIGWASTATATAERSARGAASWQDGVRPENTGQPRHRHCRWGSEGKPWWGSDPCRPCIGLAPGCLKSRSRRRRRSCKRNGLDIYKKNEYKLRLSSLNDTPNETYDRGSTRLSLGCPSFTGIPGKSKLCQTADASVRVI